MSPYRNLPYSEAVEAARKGLVFTLCWEFSGANDKNVSGKSDKFWLIERSDENGAVYRRFGKKGTTGQRQEIPSLAHGLLQGRGKEHKGYVFSFASVAEPAYAASRLDGVGEKPLISKILPAPFCHIRMVHEAPVGTWNAYDRDGNTITTLPADTAAAILSTYTLA